MNKKFEKLFEKVKFPNGASINARFAMSPMVVDGSDYDGTVGEDDIKYFERRNDSAAMLITGATSISEYGNGFGYGLGIYKDEQQEGWKRLADTMKAKGNKAIVQLFHPGYRASYTYKDKGVAYGPSSLKLDFVDYPITGLTEEQVEKTLNEFEEAAKRVIKAGFDGIEIHGANHYLLHQFFSPITNIRNDKWGGSLEKRANFPLEVVKRIKQVVSEFAKSDFIIGYRISPEEIHGENIGFTLDESLYLIDEIEKLGVDYIHTSLFGEKAYASRAIAGSHKGEPINKVIKKLINGRSLLIGAGDITSPEKILEAATEYVDIPALATVIIINPDIKNEIRDGKEEKVTLEIEKSNVSDLKLPREFYRMAGAFSRNISVPQKTKDILLGKI